MYSDINVCIYIYIYIKIYASDDDSFVSGQVGDRARGKAGVDRGVGRCSQMFSKSL